MNSLYSYAQASPGLVMERQRNAFFQQALLQHWAHPQVLSLLIGNEYGKMMINQKKNMKIMKIGVQDLTSNFLKNLLWSLVEIGASCH